MTNRNSNRRENRTEQRVMLLSRISIEPYNPKTMSADTCSICICEFETGDGVPKHEGVLEKIDVSEGENSADRET